MEHERTTNINIIQLMAKQAVQMTDDKSSQMQTKLF